MKTLNRYILEKFQITKDSTLYTCHPKDKFELRKILEERLAKDKNADLNDIDVSNIRDMHYISPKYHGLFRDLDPHNIKIDKWDVSNVKDMHSMFYFCINFNGDLGGWDVSNVEDMRGMFAYCRKFEGKGLDKWNPINVVESVCMFNGCNSLKNKPNWYKN